MPPPTRAAPRLVERSCAELERTSLRLQASPQYLRRFRQLRPADQKNRTGIGPHLGVRKNPVISVVEIGYVRRSELRPPSAAPVRSRTQTAVGRLPPRAAKASSEG